jgi:hypothetical protein
MAETIQEKPAYSGERVETVTVESPPAAAKTTVSSGTEKAWQSSRQTLKAQTAAFLEIARTRGYPSLAEFAKFLKQTRRVWLIAAGAIFGLMAAVALVERVSEWARNARVRRHELAVASVTPDRLIARCGQPAEDVTKELYPILIQTMSYQPKDNERFVLVFSRTAEEKSDWVFLSMKDHSGTRSFETPDAKIAALPCLDSTR